MLAPRGKLCDADLDPAFHGVHFLRLLAALLALAALPAFAQQMPRVTQQNGRFALMVDDKPFLMLGAQINNSSSWPSTLPAVWPALAAMHANTIEAPVYWEQMEAEEGKFDFTNVDLLLDGAREHHLQLVLLWFGTWKNGQNHYVPTWIKSNPAKYPREVSAYGRLLDVMSPNSDTNLAADKAAFSALMHHVREKDGAQHTVIMIQVENESGSVGSVRDYSATANKELSGQVPAALKHSGTWSQAYGADADERFAAYSTAAAYPFRGSGCCDLLRVSSKGRRAAARHCGRQRPRACRAAWPSEFIVTGFSASVSFEPAQAAAGKASTEQVEILQAEQGTYTDGVWHSTRIWNGDQTDRGLNFPENNKDIIRIRLQTLPFNAQQARR